MRGFREQPINPPEPQCPRCRKICWPDDLEYSCPECGESITDPECPCGWKGEWEDAKGNCPHCGFDGSQHLCVVCKKPINPSSPNYGYSICESCEEEGHRKRWEDGEMDDYMEEETEHYENLSKATENECYAIEQGATTEEEMDEILNSGGDAS